MPEQPIDTGYVTIAEVRGLANMADVAKFTDANIIATRAWFEATFEDVTGVSWVTKSRTDTLNGDGSAMLLLPRMFPRAPTAASISTATGVATALTAAELADVTVYDSGALVRRTLGRWPIGNRNVSITYPHGPPPEFGDAAPADVKEAALMAIRDRLINPDPTRQFSVQTEVGIVRTSTPGPNSPFGIQFVDEVARRRSHKVPAMA